VSNELDILIHKPRQLGNTGIFAYKKIYATATGVI